MLGDRFIDAVVAVFDVARERPMSFPEIRRGVRATRCERFPYRVYFEVQENRIIVLAVYHTARDPRRWDDTDRD